MTPTTGCMTWGQKISALVGIARRFGAREGERRYRARYDLNHDGVIDGADVSIILRTPTCRHGHGHGHDGRGGD